MYFRTIRFKIFALLLGMSLLAMGAVLATVYRSSYVLLRENEMSYNVEITSRTKEQFEITLDTVYKTAKILTQDPIVAQALATREAPGATRITEIKNILSSLLKNSIYTTEFIAGIHVVGAEPWQLFSSIPSVDEAALREICAPYFGDIGKARMAGSFTGRGQLNYYPGVYRSVIQYLSPVYNVGKGTLEGVIVIDIDYGMLEEMFLSYSRQNEDKVLIARDNGEIIFNYPYNIALDSVIEDYPCLLTEKKSQFTGKVFGAVMLIVSDSIDYTDWHIVRMISMNRITKDTQSIQTLIGRVAVGLVALSVLLSAVIARILTTPITKLLNAFQRAEKGDLSTRVEINTRDELGKLGDGFNLMIGKLADSFALQLDTQKKKGDMELKVLQTQVNPHFLYNTLDSIKWLAMLQNVNNIAEMTTALINLLRYNLSKDGTVSTLKSEIESVENYICVQKYRYGDGIELEEALAPETLDCQTLRFVLQPLVENCVVHAFGHMEGVGVVRIESCACHGKLHVRVIDNGEGMDVEKALCEEDEKGRRFKNIGVGNLRERIKLNYGTEYGLIYQSVRGAGTTAELILPLVQAAKSSRDTDERQNRD
ncbi:MAG: sensor histidine kinase [Clostridia bacterium]